MGFKYWNLFGIRFLEFGISEAVTVASAYWHDCACISGVTVYKCKSICGSSKPT